MVKGTLPKAYLRIDPNLDQTHPDCGAFVKLLCAGARQPIRGRFKTWAVFVNAVGRSAAVKHRDGWKDVHLDGEALVIDGWDIWQEGDLTVGERMQRYREKQRHKRNTAVTESLPNRLTPSETVRQQGSKALGTDAASLSPEVSTDGINASAPIVETVGLSPDEREKYAAAVWAEFLRVSEQPETRAASPAEFDVLRKWMHYPLRVVLQGIRDCKGKGQRLNYYTSAVADEVKRWRSGMVA